ncbi:hypothetical protein [Pseudorhodoferax sp. Leaf265]|uniref:hypothetical protein n=1 Tax=Pseudorhodoferax sp. Leaf265 TaxID=1736315 RepID=UPI0012E8DA03|nr:hypothetical protein [Pseudorhodoferax sp. Leaf265]
MLTLIESVDVFAAKASTAAGVRELIEQAASAGYRVRETFGWRAGSRNVVGRLSIKSRRGLILFSLDFDTGSGRTSTTRFRVTSRGGQAHVAVLQFVRADAAQSGIRTPHTAHRTPHTAQAYPALRRHPSTAARRR